MHARSLFFSCLSAILLLAPAAARAQGEQTPAAHPQAPATLVIDGLGKEMAPLDGQWQFHPGDDTAWAAPAFDDSGWEQITADKPWGIQGHPSYTGYGWYRRHIAITPVPGATPNLALLISRVDDAYELYWNGLLIGRNGKLPPHPVTYFFPPAQTYGMGQARSGVLAVRVWKAPLNSFDDGSQGGFEALPVMGSSEATAAQKDVLDYQWLRGRQFTFAQNLLYVLVGLLSLLAWLRNRKQWLLFWMACFALAPPAMLLLGGLRIPFPYAMVIGLEQPLFSLEDISLWYLLLLLLQLDGNRRLAGLIRAASWVSLIFTSLDGLVSLYMYRWPGPMQLTDGILTAIYTLLELLPFLLVGLAVTRRQRLDPARWMVAIAAFLSVMLQAAMIAVEQGSRFTHWTLGQRLSQPLFTINGNLFTPTTLANTLLLVTVVYAVYHYSIEERRRQGALEQEFKNARELQQVLIPESLPEIPGFALSSAYRPAQEVGGDFFQIIPLDGGSTLVILGDVSGKGLRAAMAVSMIVGATRVLAEITSSPEEFLARLNRRLCGRLQGGFATCIALRMEANGNCTLACAGHPAPFLNDRELDLPCALPLGMVLAAAYESISIHLQAGDHFTLYTDGLLEARGQNGELFGFDRLHTLLATRPDAAHATEAAVNFGQNDDITVLTFTRLEAGRSAQLSQPVSA